MTPGLAHHLARRGWPLGRGHDQTLLPHRFTTRSLSSDEAAEAIRTMVVRAP